MNQLSIFDSLIKHCDTYEEFDYLWTLAIELMSEWVILFFYISALAYFNVRYYAIPKAQRVYYIL